MGTSKRSFEMKHFTTYITIALALGLGLTLALLYVLGVHPYPVLAAPGDLFVTTAGTGTACTQDTPCSLQTALGQAVSGDTIYVAQGTYTGTGAAVVTVTQSITLAGGWDGAPAGAVVRAPAAYPTTLDGEGLRRVVFITGSVASAIDGFIITRGNASNAADYTGIGGGIYSHGANPAITNNIITNNVAFTSITSRGMGGGIYMEGATSAVIAGNLIVSNTASTDYQGKGGGVFVQLSNVAITDNTFQGNVAGVTANSMGGGLGLSGGLVSVNGNLIQGNTSSPAGEGFGGGFYSQFGEPALAGNTIVNNTAPYGAVTFEHNAHITLTNNIVAQNSRGVFVRGNAGNPLSGILVNNTIVQNDGEGVYVGWYSSGYATLVLTNNIVAGHTVGVYAYPDAGTNVVTATHTLFYDNITNTVGSLITSANAITGSDHLFVNPAEGDYHILPHSPAIDAGIDVPWLTTDIDGDARPWPSGGIYDIGADEARWLPPVYLPLVLR